MTGRPDSERTNEESVSARKVNHLRLTYIFIPFLVCKGNTYLVELDLDFRSLKITSDIS
jgi:hypothetical protein